MSSHFLSTKENACISISVDSLLLVKNTPCIVMLQGMDWDVY